MTPTDISETEVIIDNNHDFHVEINQMTWIWQPAPQKLAYSN